MRQHDVGALVERLHAAFQKVPGVEIVIGGPFEELAPGRLDDEVVVRRQADVLSLPAVADPRVLALVVPADLGSSSVDALSEMISSKSS